MNSSTVLIWEIFLLVRLCIWMTLLLLRLRFYPLLHKEIVHEWIFFLHFWKNLNWFFVWGSFLFFFLLFYFTKGFEHPFVFFFWRLWVFFLLFFNKFKIQSAFYLTRSCSVCAFAAAKEPFFHLLTLPKHYLRILLNFQQIINTRNLFVC